MYFLFSNRGQNDLRKMLASMEVGMVDNLNFTVMCLVGVVGGGVILDSGGSGNGSTPESVHRRIVDVDGTCIIGDIDGTIGCMLDIVKVGVLHAKWRVVMLPPLVV